MATPKQAPHPLLHQAIRGLALRCDGARSQDDQGFNGTHTRLGRILAGLDEWSYKQARWAYRALATYKNSQLPLLGIDYDAIPEPQPFAEPEHDPSQLMPPITAGEDRQGKEAFLVKLDRNHPDMWPLKDAVKAIRGARWWKEQLLWTVPATALGARALIAVTDQFASLPWGKFARGLAEELIEKAEAVRTASSSEDAELDMGDLLPEGMEPYPFQRAGIRFVQAVRRAIIGDEMGLGKTIQAICAILLLDKFPALIVCPASVKLNWVKQCTAWMAKRSPQVQYLAAQGDRVDPTADVVVVNYDLLVGKRRKDPTTGKMVQDPKTKKAMLFPVPALDSVLAQPWQALVLDESHYAKNPKAQRTQNCQKLAGLVPEDGIVMLLSGTPIKNRPVELITQLRILGVFQRLFGSWKAYVLQYCAAFQKHIGRGKYAWDTSGSSNLNELQGILRESCMIRRLKKDVQAELPAKMRDALYVELSNRKEYELAHADVIRFFAERTAADQEFLESIEHLDPDERKKAIQERKQGAEERARQAEELMRINVLRQVAAQGKVEATVDWISDFIEGTDGKLVVFAHHRDVQHALFDAFEDQAAHLFGSDSVVKRDEAVQRFISDPECRLFVASIGAGGTGVDGLQQAASNVAFVEFAWTPGDMQQAEDRLHRDGQQGDAVNVWHITAPDTIDEYFQQILAKKQGVLDAALNDGDEEEAAKVRGGSVFDSVKKQLLAGSEGAVIGF
jgi:SNF2 family DNA or RNA helicase